jgi:hypothetical protein
MASKGVTPRRSTAPISSITTVSTITNPVGVKDTGGTQRNPARYEQFVPLDIANLHGSAETADTDILASDVTPTNTPSLIRTMVMLETSGVFSIMLKNGGTTKKLKCNGGTTLNADAVYMFDFLVASGDAYNFQTSASGNVTLRVQEIVGGVQ